MANVNAASGLTPVSHINGSGWNGKTSVYYIAQADTNVYAVGDVVVSTPGAGDGVVNGVQVNGVQQVTKAGLLSNPRGVIVSVQQDRNGNGERVIPATKLRGYFVNVADDPLLIFQLQGDNTTALPLTAIGKYADLSIAPSVSGQGVSGTQLATSSIAAVGSLPLRILGIANGDMSAYAQLLVSFNLHELGGGNRDAAVFSTTLTAVPTSRSITTADFENLLQCASGVTITIPTDATLGISGTTYAPCVCLQWNGASQFVVAAAGGVTIEGGVPGLVQYGSLGLIRVGVNTWAYL